MVDSTTLKAHRLASGARGCHGDPAAQLLGRSRGGLCSKRHATSDAAGRFLALCLSPGQAGDAPRFLSLLGEALGCHRRVNPLQIGRLNFDHFDAVRRRRLSVGSRIAV
jgi:hypothetical protein